MEEFYLHWVCAFCVSAFTLAVTWRVHGGRYITACELLSYIPVQQLEMNLHIMFLYLLHIEQFCSNA